MLKLTTGSLIAAIALAVPAGATAAGMHVDHGTGPTMVHVPAYDGIKTQVHSWSRDGSTTLRLMVNGLPAGATYGAHVHTLPCGALPGASGGHFQYGATGTLAQREVWLDITPDAHGEAKSSTTVPWQFAPGTAGSVVIHALPTDPITGFADARLACTTVTFGE